MRLIYCQKKKVKMKELKVGERVTITLEVVEQSGCRGCFFETPGCIAPINLNVVVQVAQMVKV